MSSAECWADSSDGTEYAIGVFDDGNEALARYPNVWRVSHTWKGKSRLYNARDPSVRVSSISTWKLGSASRFHTN